MKKKLLSFKMLLVAAGLLVGANSAWAETTTVGAEDNTTGWWAAFSDYYTIKPNHTLTLTFTNYSDKTQNWFNWIGVVTTDADRNDTDNGYSEYLVLRADAYAWGYWGNSNENQDAFTSFTNNFNWDNFTSDMDGARVVLTVKRSNATVTVRADVTPSGSSTTYYEQFVMDCGDGTQDIRAFLTTQNGHLTDITFSDLDNNEALNYTSSYTLPENYAIKNVFIGTQSEDKASVAPETFQNVTALPSGWNKGTMSSIGIEFLAKNPLPALETEVSGIPTYVGGNALKASYRGRNYDLHTTYTLNTPVSKGDFVFCGDLYHDSYTYHYSYISVVDTEGANLLKIGFTTASGTRPIDCYYMNAEGEQTSLGSTWGLTTIRTYHAYGIKDVVIKPETGAFSFKIDYVDRNNKRAEANFSGTMKSGVKIGAVYVGSVYTDTKNTLTNSVYLDNVSLFSSEAQYDYTINYTNGGEIIKTVSGKYFADENVNAEASIEVEGLTYVPAQDATTSLTISTTGDNVLTVPVVASVPYTISYKLGDEVIDTEEGDAETGTQVTAAKSSPFWKDDVKYYIADDATTTFDITASDNDFVVALRLANTEAVATLVAVNNGTTLATFTATGLEGEESTAIFYPYAVLYEGQYYTITTDNYSATATYGGTKELVYTLNAGIKYFGEAEAMSVSKRYGNQQNIASYSSGGGEGVYGSANLTSSVTVPAGIYTVSISGIARTKNDDNFLIQYSTDKSSWTSTGKIVTLLSSASGTYSVSNVILPCDAYIMLKENNGSNSYHYIDYTTFVKTADLPSTVAVNITSAGYATYCSPYNLDLSGVTAYTASLDDTTVSFEQNAGKVAAGTGLLIKAAEGTVNIPVVTSGAEAVADNALIGVLANTEVEAGSFVLLNGEKGVGFYKTTAESFTVGANTAYIAALSDSGEGAKVRFIGLDGSIVNGITAIGQSENLQFDNSIYNLNGQRVAAPTRGLYIVNGKKVFIK